MSNEAEPIEIQISNYGELLEKLYEIAIKYRESFEGMAVSHDAGADIFVAVQDNGRRQRYVFRNPNPASMQSFWQSLSNNGYLNGSIILHEYIIRDVNGFLEKRQSDQEQAKAAEAERQRQEAAGMTKERRESRRWWTALLLQSGVAIAAAVITAILADYYSSRSLGSKVNSLEKDVASLKASMQAAFPTAADPTSQPKWKPRPQ